MGDSSLAANYAPHGRLRAALNFGNRVLVGRGANGEPEGITVDLARTLAGQLGLELELLEFERAIDVSSAASHDAWDLCFLAVDPERSRTIAFTDPYVQISGCYLISDRSGATDSREVVDRGLRIAAVDGSAYTLHLARQPGADSLVVYPDIFQALAAFDRGEVDGIAGIEEAMRQEAALRGWSRVVHPPFMQINQAMGVPAGRAAAAEDLRSRLAEMRREGVIDAILARYL